MDTQITVLLVDDDEDIRSTFSRHLSYMGYACKTACKGEEALGMLKEEHFDITFIDIVMPGMNGIELLKKLRAENVDTIPIILSGQTEIKTAVEALKLGAFDFLQKPCPPEIFELTIEKALKHNQAEQQILTATNLARLWEMTFDAWPDLAWVVNNKKSIIQCNRTAAEHFGRSKEDIIGTACNDMICQNKKGLGRCPFEHACRDDDLQPAKNSVDIWGGHYETHAVPLSSAEDAATSGWLLIARNISSVKEAEKELQDQLHFLQELIDSIPNPIYYKDNNLDYIGCNKAFSDYTGKQKENIIGKKAEDMNPQGVSREMTEKDQKLVAEGGTQSYEISSAFPGKNQIHVIFNKAAFTKSDGSIAGMVGIIQDVSERKKAEETTRKAKEDIERILSSITSILIQVGREGTILKWNKVAEETFGIPAENVLQKPFQKCEIPWDADAIDREIDRCLYTGDRRLNDIKYTRLDERPGFLGLTLNPIFDADGQPAGFLLLGTDITERRNMEIELTNARKLESIGQLAAGIAHEINTPTQYVGDNTRFLQEAFNDMFTLFDAHHQLLAAAKEQSLTPEMMNEIEQKIEDADISYLTDEVPRAIEQTLDGVENITRIVKAMKDFSHPGGQEKTMTDINKAIKSTITVARNEWKYVADLKTSLDTALPLVPLLPGEFNQVILNMIVNAAHAIDYANRENPDAKGLITVATRHYGDWVEIRICDNGSGIPETIQNRIFDPFFTTKDVGKGTGQGLAIARTAIVEKHNGRITVNSTEGSGTEFIIRLPLATNEKLQL